MFFLSMTSVNAATLWTGPPTNFTSSSSSKTDTIIPGEVDLARASSQVLYNKAAGESSAGGASPKGTEWAFGTLTNDLSQLTFKSLAAIRVTAHGNMAAILLNKDMVLHLIASDVYLSVKFTKWGRFSAGGFGYTRSTPAEAAVPTVSILTPANNTIFAAPASLTLTADATVGGGTVTNVEYFAGTSSLGAAGLGPFAVTGNITAPGSYALTAVATASGTSSTSAVVNITVIVPVPVTLGAVTITSGLFSFKYSADPGLNYVVQASSNLFDWVAVSTNLASSPLIPFSDALSTNAARFYRVERLASP
jgi:hypothetical protein